MKTDINDSFEFDVGDNSIVFIGDEDDSWTIIQFLDWCRDAIETDVNHSSVGLVHVKGFYLNDTYSVDEEVPKHLRSIEQKFYMVHQKALGEQQIRQEYNLEGK